MGLGQYEIYRALIMLYGFVTVDGRSVGTIEANLTQDAPELEAYKSSSTIDNSDTGGYARLGHKRGFYPGSRNKIDHGAEHHDVRLGHKKGFHPEANRASSSGVGSGAPAPILDKAREIALRGGPGAVSRFMAEQGYPKDGNWCGEFAASVVHAAGGNPPRDPAIASNWRNWGQKTDTPGPGDIAVRRGTTTGRTGSHVTIVEDFDPKTGRFTGLGGNQGAFEKNFPAGQYEFRHGSGSGTAPASAPSASPPASPTPGGKQVKGSWFDDASTATGLSAATTPGIALPSREGLGKMHEITGPNGQKVILPQIDVGPAAWTGRGIDISKGALDKFGYTPKNFPTDSSFTHKPVGPQSSIDTLYRTATNITPPVYDDERKPWMDAPNPKTTPPTGAEKREPPSGIYPPTPGDNQEYPKGWNIPSDYDLG